MRTADEHDFISNLHMIYTSLLSLMHMQYAYCQGSNTMKGRCTDITVIADSRCVSIEGLRESTHAYLYKTANPALLLGYDPFLPVPKSQ